MPRARVDEFLDRHRPEDYNGSWLLTGDRDALYYLDFTGVGAVQAEKLAPGLYVLENRALGAGSPKADRVAALFDDALSDADMTLARMRQVLVDHTEAAPSTATESTPRSSATCVHLDGYGTRSSCLLRQDEHGGPPRVWVADGPPCTTPYVDVSGLWGAGRGRAHERRPAEHGSTARPPTCSRVGHGRAAGAYASRQGVMSSSG